MGSTPVRWEGEVVLHDSVAPAARSVSVGGRRVGYDLDIRELVVGRAENLRRVLAEGVAQLVRVLPGASLERFSARAPGSFDHRVDVLAALVGSEIRFEPSDRRGGGWQLPEETLALKTGDCEDRALLLASLALASGVSPYNLRVALGKLRVHLAGEVTEHDHAWLMYKSERGRWITVEPLDPLGEMNARPDKPVTPPGHVAISYRPRFVFNDAHLWTAGGGDELPCLADEIGSRVRSALLTPELLGGAHRDLVTEALAFLRGSPEAWVLDPIGRYYKALPRGRRRVEPSRLAQYHARFGQACDLDAFARVIRALVDAWPRDGANRAELLDEIRAAFQEGWAGG